MKSSVLFAGFAALAMVLPAAAQETIATVSVVPEADAAPARHASAVPELERGDSFYDTYIAERLSIGVTYSQTSMKTTHVPYDPKQKHNFLGNINHLTEDDKNGFGVNVRYELCRYAALQFSMDTSSELGMWNKEHESRDAYFDVTGLTYELLLMYPVERIYTTPYIGLGVTTLSCDIDYNPWWHYGWKSPADYVANGSRNDSGASGLYRWMVPDEPGPAFTFTVGCTLQVWRYAQFDVFYRIVNAGDCDIDFNSKAAGRHGRLIREGYVPLECSSVGVSLRAVF